MYTILYQLFGRGCMILSWGKYIMSGACDCAICYFYSALYQEIYAMEWYDIKRKDFIFSILQINDVQFFFNLTAQGFISVTTVHYACMLHYHDIGWTFITETSVC